MTACPRHRELMATLAGDGDSSTPDATLAAHIALCPECRRLATDLGSVRHELEAAAASLPHAPLAPRVHRAIAQAIRNPVRARFAPMVWWLTLSGAAVMVLLLLKTPPAGTHPLSSHVATSANTVRVPFRVAEEPRLGRYQAAFRHSEASLDALLETRATVGPTSMPAKSFAALRSRSDVE